MAAFRRAEGTIILPNLETRNPRECTCKSIRIQTNRSSSRVFVVIGAEAELFNVAVPKLFCSTGSS